MNGPEKIYVFSLLTTNVNLKYIHLNNSDCVCLRRLGALVVLECEMCRFKSIEGTLNQFGIEH